jgi:hypothetical protein
MFMVLFRPCYENLMSHFVSLQNSHEKVIRNQKSLPSSIQEVQEKVFSSNNARTSLLKEQTEALHLESTRS